MVGPIDRMWPICTLHDNLSNGGVLDGETNEYMGALKLQTRMENGIKCHSGIFGVFLTRGETVRIRVKSKSETSLLATLPSWIHNN